VTQCSELAACESQAVLSLLFAHITKPEFTIRWQWHEGDVVFWDNRITQHYAVSDYSPARRVMHRATILGDRSVGK
jgi:taurine dioxygenase